MTADMLEFRLGKGPVKVMPQTFRLADILLPAEALPPLQPVVDNTPKWPNPGPLGNNRVGDCVMAAWVNLLILVASMLGGSFTISEQEVVDQYFALTGGSDVGLVELDFLRWALKNFWKGQEIIAFASVDGRDMAMVAQTITICKGIFRGIALPLTAQGQSSPNGLWDFVPNSPFNQPYSWGGHATVGMAYDVPNQRTKDATWGYIQQGTYRFWQAYEDECYAIITSETPGINRSALEILLEQLGQYTGPVPVDPGPIVPINVHSAKPPGQWSATWNPAGGATDRYRLLFGEQVGAWVASLETKATSYAGSFPNDGTKRYMAVQALDLAGNVLIGSLPVEYGPA